MAASVASDPDARAGLGVRKQGLLSQAMAMVAAFWFLCCSFVVGLAQLWWILLYSAASLPWTQPRKCKRELLARTLTRENRALLQQAFFWPTIPFTLLRSWSDGRGLWCEVDETLLLGVCPVAALGIPDRLYCQGVRAVVNLQAEYAGPVLAYERLGIRQLRLPTVDHYEPEFESLIKAVEFINECRDRGDRAYVHCKAGHGRAGAVALAWLAYSRAASGNKVDAHALNLELLGKRRVRKELFKQPMILEFVAWTAERGAQAGDS